MDRKKIDILIREEREGNLFIEDINSYDKYIDELDNMTELDYEN